MKNTNKVQKNNLLKNVEQSQNSNQYKEKENNDINRETLTYIKGNYLNNEDFLKMLSSNNFLIWYQLLFIFIAVMFNVFFSINGNYILLTIGIIGLISYFLLKFNIFRLSYITKVVFFEPEEIKKVSFFDKISLSILTFSSKYFGYFLIFALIKIFIYEPMLIPSESMYPNFNPRDFVYVDKMDKKVSNGDIVVFKFPLNHNINFIKRVIASPSDTVEINNNEIILNGENVTDKNVFMRDTEQTVKNDESAIGKIQSSNSYLNLKTKIYYENNKYEIAETENGKSIEFPLNIFNANDYCNVLSQNHIKCVIPENKYFVMGDNRDNSADSRYWGLVDQSEILGKVHKKNLLTDVQ